jgi:hypothetical protein
MITSAGAINAQTSGPFDGAYYCTAEFAGGGWYNEQAKRWEGATFKPEKGFVLKLKALAEGTEKSWNDKDVTFYEYEVVTTEVGEPHSSKCFAPGSGERPVKVYESGYVACTSDALTDYRFSLKHLRYLSSYMYGFIDGSNDNSDTPHTSGGTCTKIPQ